MIIKEDDLNSLAHYGILRKSGRYPWGSGKNSATAAQRSKTFLDMYHSLKAQGLSDVDIAQGFGMTTTQLRETNSLAKSQRKQADIAMAQRLKEKGLSNIKIGERMGINESSVRALLAPGQQDKALVTETISNFLRTKVKPPSSGNLDGEFLDVGAGVEQYLGVSKEKLGTALAILRDEGYSVIPVQENQLGMGANQKTNMKVLVPPGVVYKDIVKDRSQIKSIVGQGYSEDGGRSMLGILPPMSVNSKRVKINYEEDGGDKADGVIYVRPGKPDLSMGHAKYAQVRIAVDGSHYLKGMAIYKDDLPPGVDLVFNTNKKRADIGSDKTAAMKPLKKTKEGDIDMDNPFGAIVRQIGHKDENGDVHTLTSAMNIVNEEGQWEKWKKSLSSQMLSKQSPALIKEQLDMTYERRRNELDAIKSLTNPAVRKKLLEEYADGTDSAAVHLKAAALPRQRAQVILPVNSLKDGEVYAPNFRPGEKVVLVRFPHGGKFEIPELVVNNGNREAKSLIGQAKDAIGINSKVAARLSGADFDGDTVLVIPNNNNKVKHEPPLQGLKKFDPQRQYAPYHGMKTMDGGIYNAETRKVEFPPGKSPSSRTKGVEMGKVSNLITDMTIRGADNDELAAAVRHSMVVIDAEKHSLNYRQSAIDNGISNLRKKYQTGVQGGASTVISNSGKNATDKVNERRLRKQSEGEIDPVTGKRKNGGPIDPATGKLVWVETGRNYIDKKTGETVFNKTEVPRLELYDAHKYDSGTVQEKLYADHSNRLKAMANEARKEMVHTPSVHVSNSAKKAYSAEVASLDESLALAMRNKPRERQAQILANAAYRQKIDANPDLDESDKKKLKSQALAEARTRMGAQRKKILLSDKEWDAIQAGAISNHKLEQILKEADMDRVRELATPRSMTLMTSVKQQRAQSMLASGYSQAEVADALGVSLTTLKNNLNV